MFDTYLNLKTAKPFLCVTFRWFVLVTSTKAIVYVRFEQYLHLKTFKIIWCVGFVSFFVKIIYTYLHKVMHAHIHYENFLIDIVCFVCFTTSHCIQLLHILPEPHADRFVIICSRSSGGCVQSQPARGAHHHVVDHRSWWRHANVGVMFFFHMFTNKKSIV